VVFRVVPKAGFENNHAEELREAVQEKVGPDVCVKVEKVSAIKRTARGKHMMIDQKIKLDILSGSQDLIFKDKQ